jgi:hypothetical protein
MLHIWVMCGDGALLALLGHAIIAKSQQVTGESLGIFDERTDGCELLHQPIPLCTYLG